jgi:hypothetical protein
MIAMRTLRLTELSTSPVAREEELLRALGMSGICATERLRVTIAGRRLLLDGFADSVDEKHRVERACKELSIGSAIVNRLRVAAAEQGQVS